MTMTHPKAGATEMTSKLLKASDIIVGHTYYAKHPKNMIFGNDDRYVLGLTWNREEGMKVEYDSSTVKDGQRHPVITMGAFLRWAAGEREVIDK